MSSLAKTSRPRLSAIVPRERLFAALDRGRERNAVWVCGPPGAGKTTLIASYLESRALRCLWYQVDEGDGDLATFFYYFGLAAAQATPRRKKALPLYTPEYAKGTAAFTRRYFDELYARLKPPIAIVLDNYQEAPAESPFQDVIRSGLEAAPPGVTVFAASRVAPPGTLARLRANGALEVLEWDALRLTDDEASSIARLRKGKDVSADMIARAEGWAAGLVLMLTGSRELEARSLDQSTPQELFDYFAEEIFRKTDRKTQDFLMETAFLPRVTVAMAQTLTAHREAEAILAFLTQKNYFTTRHAGGEPAYQYHPLFREFLIARARENFSPSRIDALRSDAAKLLAAAGAIDDAVDLWLEAGNWAGVAEIVAGNAPMLLEKGRNQTIEAWLAALPDSIFQANPWLLYWRAMAKLPFAPAQSQPWLERAYELFRSRNDRPGLFLSWAGIVQSIRFNPHGDPSQLDGLIVELEQLLKENPDFPSEEIEYQVSHGMYNAMFWRMPSHADFGRWKARALSLARAAPHQARRSYTVYMSVIYELMTGQFAQARYLMETLAVLELCDLPPIVQSLAHLALAYYQRETGQNEACLDAVRSGLEASRLSGVHIWDFYLVCQGVQAQFAKGDTAAAEDLLRKAAAITDINVAGVSSWYHYLIAHLELLRGDNRAALLYAETAVRYAAGWWFHDAIAHLALCRVRWELGERDDAEHELSAVLAIARSMKSDYLLCVGLLFDAGFGFEKGDDARGLTALREALPLGTEHGFVNIIWDPQHLTRLCIRALEAGIEIEYVRKLIRIRGLMPHGPAIENWPWPIKITTLGRFEIRRDDQPLAFPRKAPKKPIALLKAIIAFGGNDVPERKLVDALWPDEEGDTGREALTITLHRLRKLLDDADAISVQDGKVSLDRRHVWVDVFAFERGLAEDQASQQALAMYRGAFLPENIDEPWTVSARERLRTKFIRHSAALGKRLADSGQSEQAIECYLRALEADDLAEELYQGAMRCYQQMNRAAEALAVYRRMRQTLSVTLGIKPSPASEALYRALTEA